MPARDEGSHSYLEYGNTGNGSRLCVSAHSVQIFPKVVLFQMNHTTITAATAHRLMVGKPLILGITLPGIADSMAPRTRPSWRRW